jgi:hypothetical protein
LQAGRITEADLDRARQRQSNGRGGVDLPDLLVEVGAITAKELERQLRLQIESVVFEMMSWREGFFSFEERSREEMPPDTRITVSTESLLMEGARRIDEWSRIDDIIPNVSVVPELAPVNDEREGAMLELLPHEWQVLTMIDGTRALREIAVGLGRDEFEIAKIAYGLATTGVITVRAGQRTTAEHKAVGVSDRLAAAQAHAKAGRHADALDELRQAAQEDPSAPQVHFDLGFAIARTGDLHGARASWLEFLRLAPLDPAVPRAQAAIVAATHLQHLLEAHASG